MESAPVYEQQHGRDDRERISRGRVIEKAGDPFESRQRHFAPDFDESGPFPRSRRRDLTEIQVRHPVQRSEGRKLENRVGEAEDDERHPDAFETEDAAEPVPEGQADRVEKEEDPISGKHPEPRVDARNTRQSHWPNESIPSAR